MAPTLVAHAFLTCKGANVSVYPPSAFGNDPWPCNVGLVQHDKTTLKDNAFARHTCDELASEVGGVDRK